MLNLLTYKLPHTPTVVPGKQSPSSTIVVGIYSKFETIKRRREWKVFDTRHVKYNLYTIKHFVLFSLKKGETHTFIPGFIQI